MAYWSIISRYASTLDKTGGVNTVVSASPLQVYVLAAVSVEILARLCSSDSATTSSEGR
jgi:hypothetical protein